MVEVMPGTKVPVKMWTEGVPVDQGSLQQIRTMAQMPFVWPHMAIMPDVHVGKGAVVGSVYPTKGAIVPAVVGVDIGCGMVAAPLVGLDGLPLTQEHLPDDLSTVRSAIENAVPCGEFKAHPRAVEAAHRAWKGTWRRSLSLEDEYRQIVDKNPKASVKHTPVNQLGTLGGGNHFIELCVEQGVGSLWLMLHSGSRGAGNNIGKAFIERAWNEAVANGVKLPHQDLAYFEEGSPGFADYVQAVGWAQEYAATNRRVMMELVVGALQAVLPRFKLGGTVVNCHHNYVQREEHFGQVVWLARKGAVSAREGELGIIPGSMGAKSFIVRGKGNKESFCTCSHGAGRVMSRGEAKRSISLEEHLEATKGVECVKDRSVIDESPKAYKDIDAVMAAQGDLVEVVHTLKQLVCAKGLKTDKSYKRKKNRRDYDGPTVVEGLADMAADADGD